jgi:hypothetical protein
MYICVSRYPHSIKRLVCVVKPQCADCERKTIFLNNKYAELQSKGLNFTLCFPVLRKQIYLTK